mgnify:CR=1 FL=1
MEVVRLLQEREAGAAGDIFLGASDPRPFF